ncbi:Na(+)/H(+) exchange regulatory cofactor NHE-RF3 isoform X2 [Lepeophtheirus salmonis]|uniref:Na(+)/H(+) exchange regulatory cofactor NHE-RF3 isoform X2 n=1 Tax=Lepeophtheirus salmonis TaxID=72036 RepID=UPI001AE632BB|nr:Na(+)/H(+) exchange regulatory cofactor NHE-RF2-like isoform X2 [Lepeophtheirus salmonis]
MVKIEGKPRLCKIVIWPDFDGYGFNLHAEKSRPGQYVGKVDEGSPAEAAGLREGDRIIEVNGYNISTENHKQVVSRIKSILNETSLLVVDSETERIYKESGLVISNEDAIEISAQRDEIEIEDEDRKSLESNTSSLDKIKRLRFPMCSTGHPGFDISYYRHNDLFAVSKIYSSAAKSAGLKLGDRIHSINNVDVSTQALLRKDLLCLIASIPNEVILKISHAPKYQNLENFRLPSVSSSSESLTDFLSTERVKKHTLFELKPRLCRVIRSSKEEKFGFSLLTDKSTDTQHIGNVYPGTPAYRAGVKPHDRIIEVNGVNVENIEHKDIVAKVNKSKRKLELLLVDNRTHVHYKKEEIKVHGAMKELLICTEKTLEDDSALFYTHGGKIRSCHIIKNEPSESFGFSIQTVKKENTKFIKEITPDGPADRSGLLLDDVVLAVNGEDVVEETHKDVVDRIISRDLDTTLLVTDRDTFNHCMEQNIPLVPHPLRVNQSKKQETQRMGSTGNSPSPRSTPSPQLSNHSPEITQDISRENEDSEYDDLNLNMTAAEMREIISSKKKRDPRKDDRMDIRRKFEIVQTL